MIRKALGLCFLVGGVLLIACSSSDDASAYPSVDSFCTALAKAECTDANAAGTNAEGSCPVADPTCQAARKNVCMTNGNTALGEGRIYTAGNVDACLTATKTAYSAPSVQANLDGRDDACARVFAGTKTKSQVCTNEFDCSGALVCDLQKNPTSGFCADKTLKNVNDGCGDPGSICNTGLYCEVGAQDFCRAKRALGDACGPTFPCVENTFCNGTQCVALAPAAAACTADAECSTTFCNTQKGLCQARLYPSEHGLCTDYGGT